MTTILFDLDGTLIDSTAAILEAFEYACVQNHFPVPSESAITSLIGYPLDVMFEKSGVSKEQAIVFVDSYKSLYRQISNEKTDLLPKAREAVESAAEFSRLGVVTTKTARYSRILLEHLNIMHRFEVLIGREDVENPKPHPEPILKAMESMKADRDHTWMIGDTCMDILSAKAAKINAIGVTSGYATPQQLKECDSLITSDVYEAIAYLRSKT